LKVLIVTPYRNFPGGVEKYNSLIEEILVSDGSSVEYLTTDDYPLSPILKFKKKVFGMAAITAKRFKNIDSSKYDLIICNGEFSLGIKHPNVLNIFHGSFLGFRDFLKNELSLKHFLSLTWQSVLQASGSTNKKVVTVSKFNATQLEKQGIKVKDILLNPVDLEKYTPKDCKRAGILNVSTYKYFGKGFDLLKKLSCLRDDITCVTNKRPDFNCRWIESVGGMELAPIYNEHKVVIIPSRYESASLVALEAMACGVPIVMNRVGYALEIEKIIPEFVLPIEDLLDAKTYDERIELIISNYDELSKKARDYVEAHHSMKTFKTNFLKIIKG